MWFTMATAGLGIMSAFGQKDQAEQQAMQQKSQIAWDNHVQALSMAAKNREVAKANAYQWMVNQEITKLAYQQEAEEKVYLRATIDNELGTFSRNAKGQNDQLMMAMESRGLRGGTAKAIFNSAQLTQDRIMEDQAVTYSNVGRDIGRKREQTLAARNFNYNGYSTFMAQTGEHIDVKAAGKQALMSGLMSAASSTLGTGMQEMQMGQQQQFQQTQMKWMNQDTSRWQSMISLLGGGY